MIRSRAPVFPILVGCLAAACDSGPTEPQYDPDLPEAWAASVTNPYFPLVPGTTWEYEGETDEGTETILVEVLSDVRNVNGVSAVIVRDRVYLDGDLIEDTFDWFAQDEAGNVWYLGEDSKEIEDGEVVSTEGSWEWGVDGALPGIIMWADPGAHVGEDYKQEYYPGVAEDWGSVAAVGQSVSVPYGPLSGCIRTKEWNALEEGANEDKYYCPGVGLALEVADDERVELVGLEQ